MCGVGVMCVCVCVSIATVATEIHPKRPLRVGNPYKYHHIKKHVFLSINL